MMEGKVLSREILWCLSVDYIVEIVWGLPQRLVVRREVLLCSERVLRQEALERFSITHLRKEKDISVKQTKIWDGDSRCNSGINFSARKRVSHRNGRLFSCLWELILLCRTFLPD